MSHREMTSSYVSKFVIEKSGKTVIAITHRLDSIRAFDNILMFQEGRIVEQGGFNELIEKRQYFHKLYHL